MTTENKKTIKRMFLKSFVSGFLVVFLFINFGRIAYVQAQSILVTDVPAEEAATGNWMDSIANWGKQFVTTKFYEDTLKNAVAETFWSATSKALNTLAYDTATWIGSGGKGQKPLFVTEGWDKYLANIGDNFAGEYIETLSKQWDANLCNPSFDIKIKILGGLAGPYRKKAPACTFTQMKKNWESELARPDFLNRFQNMFEPNSNDLGIALSLQTNLIEASNRKADFAKTELASKKGWLDVRNIGGYVEGMPTQDLVSFEMNKKAFMDAELMTKFTGTFADAVNVFLNQLASTLFSNLLKKLVNGNVSVSSPYTGDYGLINYTAGGGSGGIAAAQDRFKKIVQPDFTVRGDYDVLAELTMCPDPNKAGPTNCVITDKFRQAIAARLTVGEAMDQKYLNQDAIFGFRADGLEPKYNEDYPYRSMIILRKFRILPVGWEVAAQYIKDPVNGTNVRTLKDLVDCFSNDDSRVGYSAGWCNGLVDPDWVLKAPLNYCKKEGYGPEILSESITGEGSDSKLAISRNNNYCADEQSCIKEKADGSCDVYGYCTEEKRKWNFGSNSCEPIYNTCQTFRSRDGSTVSYLQNGLDYDNCSADSAGCREYALGISASNGFYNIENDTIKWSLSSASSTFNRQLSDCDDEGEGCHQFIRTEMENGANIFGGFEDLFGATADATSAFGDKSVKLISDIATTVPAFKFDIDLKGYYYTFSVSAKNCGTSGTIRVGDSVTSYSSSTLETTDQWQRFAVSHYFNKENESNDGRVWIGLAGADYANCQIDGVKVEKSKNPTVFSEYAQSGVIYEKLLPNYLEYVCYDEPGSNYSLKSAAPAICNEYARKCNADEVGCEMFTAATDQMTIPASVIPTDYCDASCVGYDEYLQSESAFDSQRSAYLIPTKAKTCGAEAVGCDGFTNLDKVGNSAQKEKIDQFGAENIEYYSELKQCVKTGDATCAEFYTWEGSSETGFQLKVYQLKADNESDPAVTNDSLYNNKVCDSDTYGNLDNPMCFEFYNKTGKVSYKFLPYTITCSDNCHPYRRTAVNVDESITTQSACSSVICSDEGADKKDRCWDGVLSACNVCLNGGKWSVAGQACIYDAIPGEGKTCAASQDGCREYNGNSGANVQIVLQSDFEGSAAGWEGLSGTQAILDSESLKSGENSLKVTNTSDVASIYYDVSDVVRQGKSYHLAFLAKGESNLVDKFLSISFDSGVASSTLALNSPIKTDWNLYELNLSVLDHDITIDEKLIITANGGFFIDNIILTEITDRYYLIKDSSVVPDICNNDIFGNYKGPEYNLGCAEYSAASDNNKHYLRQFSSLCQESAIGCEMMVDTHNSSGVADDNIAFVVYSKDKECASEEKGCERMGEVSKYDSGLSGSIVENIYTDVYKINNPDNGQAKCAADQVGCEEWSADTESDEGGSSISYFKDPFDMTCEWRQKANSTDLAWYRKKINRCGGIESGHICKSDNDCVDESGDLNKVCKLYDRDILCAVSDQKTIGYGGRGNIVDQPSNHWVGICPTSQSTCTEYIDPISNFSSNTIYNSNFSQDVDGNLIADGWSANKEQGVTLEPNTLYTFSVKSGTDFTTSIAANNLTVLNEGNLFVAGGAISISVNNNTISKSFYSNNSSSATVKVDSIDVASGNSVSLKKSVIDYQLSKSVNRDECNGALNPGKGCVLFNERIKAGVSYGGLVYDADTSVTTLSSVAGQNDSNALLKVSPDRACDKWLACKSYVKDENNNNVCYGVGLCDSLDSSGNCSGFITTKETNQIVSSGNTAKYQNVSGYSEVGASNNSFKKDMIPLAAMTQDGGMTLVSNGDFENFDADGYPLGWDPANGLSWNKNLFSVINNPVAAQTEGVKYAGKGRAFLKYSPAAGEMWSDFIDVEPGSEYNLSADINTLNLFAKDNAPLSFKVKIQSYTGTGSSTNFFDVIDFNSGRDWNQEVHNFWTAGNVFRIKIQFLGWLDNSSLCSSKIDACSGSVYVDNVAIRPALKTRVTSTYYDTVVPTCRLYPESDSLSCEYYEDSGIKKKGRYGYCLEYDRYPGNPNACLLWYPVDRVRGDWDENVVGYQGKMPVYYCEEAKFLTPLEYRWDAGVMDITGFDKDYSDGICAPGYVKSGWSTGDEGCGILDCIPSGECLYDCQKTGKLNAINGWYVFNGFQNNPVQIGSVAGEGNTCGQTLIGPSGSAGENESKYGIKFYDPFTKQIYDDVFAYCSKVVQTVTAVGGNKYWSARVYPGSSYKTVDQNYGYNYASSPFGSIIKPLQKNVSGWDGGASDGIQPVYVTNKTDMPRAGFPYHFDDTPAGVTMGACSTSTRLCLHVDGADGSVNKADCQSGEGACAPISHNVTPPESIKRIFAQSYGVWIWDANQSRYVVKNNEDWSAPTRICPGNPPIRPVFVSGDSTKNDFCGIPPKIDNFHVNGSSSNVSLERGGYLANLTFNSILDSQQMPLTMYTVNWGDGNSDTVSGIEMLPKTGADNPHSLYYLYSYWDLKAKNSVDNTSSGKKNTVYCGVAGNKDATNASGEIVTMTATSTSDFCAVKPRVKLKDNWGWCTEGVDGVPCPSGGSPDGYWEYTDWIMVTEK